VKNGFALVQAIARQRFGKSEPKNYRSFSERLSAQTSTYDLLLSKDASASMLHDVVSVALVRMPTATRIVFWCPAPMRSFPQTLPFLYRWSSTSCPPMRQNT
jgi:hypothetical protein